MAWIDRLRESAYTSPSGERLTFFYEDVRKAQDKKTAAFQFPDADGTYIQDLGKSGRRYPLRMFFWGADYDLESEAFEAALLERGIGKLEHPIYGVINVVPFGTITRRDDLKTKANQSIIEVVFWETIDLVYPASQSNPSSRVLESIDIFNDVVPSILNNETLLDTIPRQIDFKGVIQSLKDATESALQFIASTDNLVFADFRAIASAIDSELGDNISDVSVLGSQIIRLIQTPAKAILSISDRLESYSGLVQSITGFIANSGPDQRESNKFHGSDTFAMSYVSAAVLSAVNNQFTTKPEALSAAEEILDIMDTVTNWRDLNYQALSEVDTGESYQTLQDSVSLAAGFLVEISFTLKQERTITLDRSRTIIDLAAELYGTVDSDLDFLINTNNLSGSEIIELPIGRKIAYYI